MSAIGIAPYAFVAIELARGNSRIFTDLRLLRDSISAVDGAPRASGSAVYDGLVDAKARPPRRDRAWSACSANDQPRVRERIMKLSKVYSATCHHRY